MSNTIGVKFWECATILGST